MTPSTAPPTTPRVAVVGAGFAGHQATRTLLPRLGGRAEVVVVNPTDHSLYLPLLPEVAGPIHGAYRAEAMVAGGHAAAVEL
jgi:NADH dehydrogenase